MNWNELAPKIEFDLMDENDNPREMFPDFSVWEWGTGRNSKILGGIKTAFDKGRLYLADYEYEHSRNLHAPAAVGMQRGLSLCFIQHEDIKLPDFNMRSEAPIFKVYKRAVGKYDIFFAEDPEFSEHFEIQGPEAEIHQLFRPEIRSYFMRHFEFSQLRLEVRGNCLLLHFGMMIRPEDSRLLIYRAVEIANFWTGNKIKMEIPPEYLFTGN